MAKNAIIPIKIDDKHIQMMNGTDNQRSVQCALANNVARVLQVISRGLL